MSSRQCVRVICSELLQNLFNGSKSQTQKGSQSELEWVRVSRKEREWQWQSEPEIELGWVKESLAHEYLVNSLSAPQFIRQWPKTRSDCLQNYYRINFQAESWTNQLSNWSRSTLIWPPLTTSKETRRSIWRPSWVSLEAPWDSLLDSSSSAGSKSFSFPSGPPGQNIFWTIKFSPGNGLKWRENWSNHFLGPYYQGGSTGVVVNFNRKIYIADSNRFF